MATYKNIDDLLEIIDDWQKTLLPIEAPEDKVVFTVLENVNDYIHDLDTTDVVEVVHGEWERILYSFAGGYRCSCCGCKSLERHWKYCPECGAVMDGKKE